MSDYKHTDLSLCRRLLVQARPYWPHITAILLFDLVASGLGLLAPLPLKIAVDSVVGTHPVPQFVAVFLPSALTRSGGALLLAAAGLLVLIAVLVHLQSLFGSMLRTYTSEKLVLDFRGQLFRHAQRLSLAYHDAMGTSESTYRIQWDSASIQYVAIDKLISFVTACCTLAMMLSITMRLDWQIALVALAVSPVLFLVSQMYRRRLREDSRVVKKLESSALSVIHEVLSAVRVVKAFGQEEREHRRFVGRSSESVRARVRLSFLEGGFALLVGLTTAVGTAAVLILGVWHVRSGVLTLGELLMVMAYLSQLYSPLKTISKQLTNMQSSLAGAERAYALLDETPEVLERPQARALGRACGAVSFRRVAFAYEPGRTVLHDVSFDIPPGSRVGIAGPTGAGKTTLVSLLIRFFDPSDGQILLDGVDLRDYKLADLRDQFGIVLQEPVLFSTSISENIAYARPDASEEEIIEAASAAGAHDFIVNLPDGYATRVGERGMRLSGGERQRVSLARAFLKDARILILDEPTSSVDVQTEATIMEAMDRLMHGRTTFIIAHRLSTLENCDVRLELQDGHVLHQRAELHESESAVLRP